MQSAFAHFRELEHGLSGSLGEPFASRQRLKRSGEVIGWIAGRIFRGEVIG
jgi:hypothetical protein